MGLAGGVEGSWYGMVEVLVPEEEGDGEGDLIADGGWSPWT